jgi:hypothetical protein
VTKSPLSEDSQSLLGKKEKKRGESKYYALFILKF